MFSATRIVGCLPRGVGPLLTHTHARTHLFIVLDMIGTRDWPRPAEACRISLAQIEFYNLSPDSGLQTLLLIRTTSIILVIARRKSSFYVDAYSCRRTVFSASRLKVLQRRLQALIA